MVKYGTVLVVNVCYTCYLLYNIVQLNLQEIEVTFDS